MLMKTQLLSLLAALPAAFASSARAEPPQAIDPTVSEETAYLLANLHHLAWETDSFMFGQEFPLS